jgi:Family of unknown function (DUF6152)
MYHCQAHLSSFTNQFSLLSVVWPSMPTHTSRAVWLAPLMLLSICVAMDGHHVVRSTYKVKETATVEGKVLQFLFRNPHSYVRIQAADGSTWVLEWDTVKKLRKQGVQQDTLRAGDDLIITGSPPRRADERRMLIRVLRRQSDGFVWGLGKGEVIE